MSSDCLSSNWGKYSIFLSLFFVVFNSFRLVLNKTANNTSYKTKTFTKSHSSLYLPTALANWKLAVTTVVCEN